MGSDPAADLEPAAIHPTAIVEAGAAIGPGCRIGPYCVIGPDVRLGAGCVLHSHVVIGGATTIGEGTSVYPFAALGLPPQHRGHAGERTELVMGARNTVREYATISPGTVAGGGRTRIGSDCFFMMHAHVAHDCTLGDGVIMANCATLAGHCSAGENVVIGGLAAVHQFVRIGRGAMIGGLAGVVADVIPYGMVVGERAALTGLNLVGLKRRKAERAEIRGLRAAFEAIFRGEGTLAERVRAAKARHDGNGLVAELAGFIEAESTRSLTLPPG